MFTIFRINHRVFKILFLSKGLNDLGIHELIKKKSSSFPVIKIDYIFKGWLDPNYTLQVEGEGGIDIGNIEISRYNRQDLLEIFGKAHRKSGFQVKFSPTKYTKTFKFQANSISVNANNFIICSADAISEKYNFTKIFEGYEGLGYVDFFSYVITANKFDIKILYFDFLNLFYFDVPTIQPYIFSKDEIRLIFNSCDIPRLDARELSLIATANTMGALNDDIFENLHFQYFKFDYSLQSNFINEPIFFKDVNLINGKFIFSSNYNTLLNPLESQINKSINVGIPLGLFTKSQYNSYASGVLNPVENRIVHIDCGIILPGLTNENWFHFIFESLAYLIENISYIDKDLPILLSKSESFQVDVLQNLGFSNFQFIDFNVVYRIGKVLTFNCSALIPSALEDNLNSFKVDFDAMHSVRNHFLKLQEKSHRPKISQSKIFMLRSYGRRSSASNLGLLKLLRSNGYTEFDYHSNSFLDQLNVYSQISECVIQGGAAMANFIFMQPGTKILYCTNEASAFYELPRKIAQAFDLDFRQVHFPFSMKSILSARTNYDIFHHNYEIDENVLSRFV
jgi:hypothetical protein